MDRLIVEAVPAETQGMPVSGLRIYVSVSRAKDGTSVTGLTKQSFRITTSHLGEDPIINDPPQHETSWEPNETVHSGCYVIIVGRTPVPVQPWEKGQFYGFRHPGPHVRETGETEGTFTRPAPADNHRQWPDGRFSEEPGALRPRRTSGRWPSCY